ncbi:uncharacterized protein [Venturia canescens]|uniref:uncharacterized protein n=1 Tax=Venturia canescens TaxID=32260 RepID=UPI001C9BE62D|nr:uncharacterized protein LOC122410163 [Venturia canescens]XP_043274172.1 uncharacterized protein LOC122410163 [Venturia canescens]
MPLLTEMMNVWNLRLHSLLYLTNFTFYLPNDNKVHYEQGTRNEKDFSNGIPSLVLFTIWFLLYWAYKNFLNLILRRMKFAIIRRLRLIEGLWCCCFATCSVIFLVQFAPQTRNCPWHKSNDYHFGFLMHKTFYLHQAAIQVFSHDHWLKGWSSQLFATGIPLQSLQKSPDSITALLLYKASETALLNICRLLVTLSRGQIVRRIAKVLFSLYFFNWIYVHTVLVPRVLLLYTDVNYNLRTHSSLWLWLICELINSIRYKEFGCIYSKETLETSLFPRPSEEAVEFVNILKKHRSCIKNKRIDDESATTKKTELWQTLVCAMTMKKKLKKLRESKREAVNKINIDSNDFGNEINEYAKNDVMAMNLS